MISPVSHQVFACKTIIVIIKICKMSNHLLNHIGDCSNSLTLIAMILKFKDIRITADSYNSVVVYSNDPGKREHILIYLHHCFKWFTDSSFTSMAKIDLFYLGHLCQQ